ncbi:MAG: hypothetical protein ACI4R9_01625 [Kiritimatiellia bacterium]
MGKFIFVGVVALVAGLRAEIKADALVVVEAPWATIEYPRQWDPATGKGFTVKVNIKKNAEIPPQAEVTTYLDWFRAGGYGGFAAWQPGKKAEPGKTYTFNFHPKKIAEDCVRFDARAFLAPKSDWNQRTAEAHCEVQLPPPPAYLDRPTSVTFKKSYIWIEDVPPPVKVGDEFVLSVHYYLDPSDTWGPKQTRLSVTPLGPWIDNPDGKINKTRHHVSYGGSMFTQEQKVDPGEHVAEFRFRLGKSYRYNMCFFLCKFKQPDGTDWPWDWRGGTLRIVPANETFRLVPDSRGGLFAYDETPAIHLLWSEKCVAGTFVGKAVVRDVFNRIVLEKDVKLYPSRRVQRLTFPELEKRGVFSLTLTVPNFQDGRQVEEFCYFGRIPHFERRDGVDTPFGVTHVDDEELSVLAASLGFTYARHFVSWKSIQPAREKWHLKSLDCAIGANAAAGLRPWIMLNAPPAWALPAGMGRTGEFEPAPFDLTAWGDTVESLVRRYQGKLWGFEFLNEIVPGRACADPVATYVDICRVGHERVKRTDPRVLCQLAGGLWPHSFRVDLLNAGVAKYVDFLPVHYGNYESVMEAKDDLAARGFSTVRVCDNESASGMSIWNYPPEMAFEASLKQCHHVMTRWPDELCAGAQFICYFGGQADACGNWSYLLDPVSPRPCAATLAVVQNELAYAKPLAKFYLGETVAHLFEKEDRAVLFLSTPNREKVAVRLPAPQGVTVVDFQGNVTKSADGTVLTGDMPVIVRGADLPSLKLAAALHLGASHAPSALPQVVAEDAPVLKIPFRLKNFHGQRKTFSLTPQLPAWATAKTIRLALDAGEERVGALEFQVTGQKESRVRLSVAVSVDNLAAVQKPYQLFVSDSRARGNFVANGTFDDPITPWKGQGRIVSAPLPGLPKNTALELVGRGKGYVHQTSQVELPIPGATYLYAAWVKGEGMGGGSNLDEIDSKGRNKNYMKLHVWTLPDTGSKGWQYLSKKLKVGPDARKLAMTPVAQGAQGARVLYDNVQLALYRGSDFMAFAAQDRKQSSPIPLLCENQLFARNGYSFDAQNGGGVAHFSWTKEALRLTVVVEDDVMDARPVLSATGEETLAGDALALSIFPQIGPDDRPSAEQLRWYISAASPGGGSGAATVFRPKAYSMGAKAGQLCKDSSVYQVEIQRTGTQTRYDLHIPWTEIPGFAPGKGARFGCNLSLFDSDKNAQSGEFRWGAGLKDTAADCGLVTLE